MPISNITFTINTGLSFKENDFIKVIHDDNNYINGRVVSYNISNGQLVFTPLQSFGSGTYSTWEVILVGVSGTAGSSGTSGAFISNGSGLCSSMRVGVCNSASGNYSNALGGQCNTASGCYSSIFGGQNNIACAPYSGAFGCNVCNTTPCSFASNNLIATSLTCGCPVCVGSGGLLQNFSGGASISFTPLTYCSSGGCLATPPPIVASLPTPIQIGCSFLCSTDNVWACIGSPSSITRCVMNVECLTLCNVQGLANDLCFDNGGSFNRLSCLSAPSLNQINGNLVFGCSNLTCADLPNLKAIRCNVTISQSACLTCVILPCLTYVGQDLNLGNAVGVGSFACGGLVIYISQPGDATYNPNFQTGIVAALSDAGFYRWFYNGTYINVNNTSLSLFTGCNNTNLMINQFGTPPSAVNYSAWYARCYTSGVYTDWFLPSSNELSLMYPFKSQLGLLDSCYWSSSNSSLTNAYYTDMTNGNTFANRTKDFSMYIRSARYF